MRKNTVKNNNNSKEFVKDCKGKSRNANAQHNGKRSYSDGERLRNGRASDEATNDIAWYSADPALLRDAASIPYSWATGTVVDLHNPVLKSMDNKGKFSIPGICAIRTMPSVGWADSATSPVNVAANSLYTFIRSYNSGSKNYDAPDLMLYLLSVSQAYSFLNWCQRIYGTASLYSMRNRYLPKALLEAMYVDYQDVIGNMAQFRYWINMFINKLASLAVPNTMAFFAQQAFLYKDIYVEGESVKDQIYFYQPDGFWIFQLNTDGSGMLNYKQIAGDFKPVKISDIIAYGEMMLAPIIGDEDFNIMSGDIYKAYGDRILKLASLPEYYPITPVYNLTVLEQMKNAVCVAVLGGDFTGRNVTQDPTHAFLIHQPHAVGKAANTVKSTMDRKSVGGLAADKLLNTSAKEATPDITMENSRLCVAGLNYQEGSTTQDATVELHPGNVIPVAYIIHYYDVDSTGAMKLSNRFGTYTKYIDADSADIVLDTTQTWSLEQSFKFHPAHYVTVFKHGSAANEANAVQGFMATDVDNYAVLSNEDLSKLHEAAILSMLNAKPVAKV